MNNHPKVVRDLIERGADPLKEDRMGLTPLHFAHLIGNPAVIDAFGDKGKLEPFSSSHMATPQEIKEATSFAVADPKFNIKVPTTLPHTIFFDTSWPSLSFKEMLLPSSRDEDGVQGHRDFCRRVPCLEG